MRHFLDALPFDFTDPASQELRDLLAAVYYREGDVVRLLLDAGLPPASINLGQPMLDAWHDILEVARSRAVLRELLARVRADPRAQAYVGRLDELMEGSPVVEAPAPSGNGKADAAIDWHDEGGDERILGPRSTLLGIAFLEEGTRVAAGVVRVRAGFDTGSYYGSGFLVGPGLVLTNHHVLFQGPGAETRASRVRITFRYEADLDGRLHAVDEYTGDVASIVGDKKHDWAVIRVSAPLREPYPILPLGSAGPVEIDDAVYIIQHPDGGPKQIGLEHTTVRHVDDDVVQYLSDTKAGSSGSPVFNERWQVVALHHRWVRSKGTTGERREYRNQGRRIERVAEGLARAGVAFG